MLDAVAAFIENSGVLIYVLAPLFMVLVAVLPFPAEVPAMLNGVVFGPVLGSVVTWGGAVVGAALSFEIARRYGRPVAARVVPPAALGRADRLVHATGWPGLLVARLIPAIAFTALNWGLGLSAVPRSTFLWTTALGILPGAVAFTAFGTGLGALYLAHRALALTLIGLLALALVVTGIRYWRHAKSSPDVEDATGG